MNSDTDERDLPGEAPERPAADSAPPEWSHVYAECEAFGPDDAAWDSASQFLRAFEALAGERLTERERVLRARIEAERLEAERAEAERAEAERAEVERREAVSAARGRLAIVVEALRTAPGGDEPADSIARALEGDLPYERAPALTESAAAIETSIARVAGLRAQLVRDAQGWASPDDMEALVHTLRAEEAQQSARLASLLANLSGSAQDDAAPALPPAAEIPDGDVSDALDDAPVQSESVVAEPVDQEALDDEPVTAPLASAPRTDDAVADFTPAEEPSGGVGTRTESSWPAGAALASSPLLEPETPVVATPVETHAPAALAPVSETRGLVMPRAQAESVYSDAPGALRSAKGLPALGRELATLWGTDAHKRPAHRERLRRILFEHLASSQPGTAARKSFGMVNSKSVRIDLREPRARMRASGSGSVLLAKLEAFDALVISSAPVPEGLSPLAFAQNLLTVSGSDDEGRAVQVFLAPQLQPAWREEAIRKIRSSGMAAAVIDDVDVCRLLSPGGRAPHGLPGLLEIVIEQLGLAANPA